MSRESLIFLLVVLAVWGLSVVARWLQEEIERKAADRIEPKPIAEPLSLETETVSKPEKQPPLETIKRLSYATLEEE